MPDARRLIGYLAPSVRPRACNADWREQTSSSHQSYLLADEEEDAMAQERKSRRRGFAAMDPKKQREIASKGGRAAHLHGAAHEWSSDEARMAGRKGGAMNKRHDVEMMLSN